MFFLTTHRTHRLAAPHGARSAISILLASCGVVACGDDSHPTSVADSAVLIGDEPDASYDDAESTRDAQSGEGVACRADSDCDDGQVCDDAGTCGKAAPTCTAACSAEHPCDPNTGACDCTHPDADLDGDPAIVCGGHDCNDADALVSSLKIEVCFGVSAESRGRDEDCNPRTFYDDAHDIDGDSDRDGDGFVSAECLNVDADGVPHRGDDCDDESPNIHPKQTEACDYFDNNCDGLVDELEVAGAAPSIPGGLREASFIDFDHDGHGSVSSPVLMQCRGLLMESNYVFEAVASDLNDHDPTIYDGAPESCDGVDSNGDGLSDARDPALIPHAAIAGTRFACGGSAWTITQCPSANVLWCGGSVADGCTTDATLLTSCRACQTDCKFSCGTSGCDEITKFALGNEHSCALSREGRVACWGRASYGRLGHESTDRSTVPMWLPRIHDARDVTSGYRHACAVLGPSRALWCWGSNEFLQLGSPDGGTESVAPVHAAGVRGTLLGDVQSVSAGRFHTCAVLASGSMVCFGEQGDGRLANTRVGTGPLPTGITYRNVHEVSEDGDVYLTGDPVDDAVSVSVGDAHGCALRSNKTVECWGDNSAGQLGGATTSKNWTGLIPVPGLPATVASIAAGHFHTCAIADGKVYCWGSNSSGQLGLRAGPSSRLAVPVTGIDDAEAVSAGTDFSCVRRASGVLTCWGATGSGQLGPFTGQAANTPPHYRDFASGAGHSCAVDSQGQAVCWGSNAFGQLGIGGATIGTDNTLHPLLAVQGTGQ